MCDDILETIISNLEIANKLLGNLTDSQTIPETDRETAVAVYDIIKQSLRLISDDEISNEINSFSKD